MSEAVVDDIVAVLPPLLRSLEALSFIARHLNPPDFDRVMDAAGAPDQDLRAAIARIAEMGRMQSYRPRSCFPVVPCAWDAQARVHRSFESPWRSP